MNTPGLTPLFDAEGRFIWNTLEYNAHKVYPFPGLKQKLDAYRKSFTTYDDDVYLLAYSKSGSHWLFEIVMMLTRGSADYRQEAVGDYMLDIRYDPSAEKSEGRRVISTHLPLGAMPADILNNSSGKFIQIYRNPADVSVSFYHHLTSKITEFGGHLTHDWDSFISQIFCDKKKMCQLTWWDYTTEWWTESKDKPNYLPVFYEELKENPLKVIGEIADFLELGAYGKLVEEIANQVSFDLMSEGKRKYEKLGPAYPKDFTFYRKGIIGDWKNHFTKEQYEQFMTHHNQELQKFPELYQKFNPYLQL